ncbi:polysaccharide deacetylase family protein [Trichococcus collinsii]|uniref:Peptidoglycan/xylan/chitin deacetylase, PgdA/CDA1 family n=1 Tax=Trichococcus collinsii TaxID=157076 RepID=A0AB37ZWR3_9LACT|nr:polysaccharide deacetylase family protein [Trichococcus collinsii]CZQ82155.1 polysaccharide deacetylase [Trichococcus collinsii]SDZ88021.1 Peptidoglycan/xylan/chitin deacetylase, PgdA/CDA1 family [Trichococcus collinsii]
MLRGKKIALVFTSALVLSACADQVKETTETMTQIKTEETEIVNQLNELQQLETALQEAFNASLASDEELKTFKDGSAAVFSNLEERRTLTDSIESALEGLAETKDEFVAFDEETLPLDQMQAIGETLDLFSENSLTYLAAYRDSLDKEEELLTGFGADDATFDTFFAGIEAINLNAETNQTNLAPVAEILTTLDAQLVELEAAIAAIGKEGSTAADSSAGTAESSETVAAEKPAKKVEPVSYEYRINPEISTVQPIAEDGNTQVALLTFDDAPQQPNSYTVEIAETVKSKDANAIFFVMGQFLTNEQAREDIKTVYDMGFEIGNHSYSHPDFQSLTYDEQLEEIKSTNDLIEEITGERPRFLRAPYGQYNDDTIAIAAAEGMTIMNWTYGYDWVEEFMEGTALADVMVNSQYLGDGANLLMHDRPWTNDAIAAIIDGLRAKEITIVDPNVIESPEREEM